MTVLFRRGSVAGIWAGITVAAGIFVYDLIALEPFATPTVLARNITGAPVASADIAGLEWFGTVLRNAYSLGVYTLAHLAIFAILGIAGAWVFQEGRSPANVLTGALFGIAAGSAVFYAGHALLAPTFVMLPAWQLILAMNAVAGVVLVAQLTEDPVPDPSVAAPV